MKQYIDKSALIAWIKEKKIPFKKDIDDGVYPTYFCALMDFEDFLDTLEVKEVNIAEMADDYYDALMEEAAVWMDKGTMVHCRLAYYNGCKDVLNKLQKGE